MSSCFFLYILSLGIGFLGAWSIALWGHKLSLIDKPVKRSSHQRCTPKGGGIGILIGFILICFFCQISWTFYIPIIILSLVSLLGDKTEISPQIRLFIQFFAATITLLSIDGIQKIFIILGVSRLPNFWHLCLFIGLLVFIVGTANFYNFMDGINGIAGITGVVAFSFLGYVSFTKELTEFSFIALGIALACLGFLPWNIPKARVFMGDVGSVLLGFLFAILVISLAESLIEFFCYVGVLLPFYSDELLTMFERIKNRESLAKAHRRHLYQVLANEGGIEHWQISIGYGLVQLIVCLFLYNIQNFGLIPILIVIIALFGLFTIISLKIKQKLY